MSVAKNREAPTLTVEQACAYGLLLSGQKCRARAYYFLELGSREGTHCRTVLCKRHIHKAWLFGQRLLQQRFPKRRLNLSSIRLMPIGRTLKIKQQFARSSD